MNKLELIQKIKQLDGLSQDEKAYLLNLVNTKKKYGLVWEDKPEDVEELLRTHLPVLREVPEKRILAKPQQAPKTPAKKNTPLLFDEQNQETIAAGKNIESTAQAPNHILIEGDNLHALTALTFTHEGKIDVIYIDPPYNTGNKDFKYNDQFVDSEDSYRHSKWISFFEKRLKKAKRLLVDKGIIFISINDIEQASLKLLCDEILGEENFISTFIWHSRQNVDSRTLNGASNDHEYVLCYSKTSSTRIRGKVINTEKYKNPDNDPRGPWMSSPIDGLATAESRPNLHYTIIDPETNLEYNPSKSTGWRFQRSTVESLIAEGRIIWPKNRNSKPRMKRYLNELKNEYTGFSSILNVDFTTQGTNELRLLMGEETLKFPKPVSLIRTLIEQSIPKNSIVLDFFAGSGTALHATMELNDQDDGNRSCILVTNNENNIAEEVCYERNKRVIRGYTNSKDQFVEGLTNNNLRYYKTGFVSREPSLKNKKELTRLATELLCIKEDCYHECTTAFSESAPDTLKLFENQQGKFLCVIYDDNHIDEGVATLKKLMAGGQVKEEIKVYVFSNGQYPYTEDFEEVLEHITLCALPDAIYKAYMNVLPKKQRETIPELEEPEAEEGLEILDESEGTL